MTTPYTHDMWKTVLTDTKTYTTKSPTSVLMLGLGAGGQIRTLHSLFENCTVIAVEYDPTMVDLFERLRLYAPFPKPTVITGDAKHVVSQLTETYSLVLVDLFIGPDPAPFISSPEFLNNVKKLLADDGLVIINANATPRHLDAAGSILKQKRRWQYETNHLGLYGKG